MKFPNFSTFSTLCISIKTVLILKLNYIYTTIFKNGKWTCLMSAFFSKQLKIHTLIDMINLSYFVERDTQEVKYLHGMQKKFRMSQTFLPYR